MKRAKYTGRSDDNMESIKLRFETFKAETLPIAEMFKSYDKLVEIDTSKARDEVYKLVHEKLSKWTELKFS